MSEEKLKCCEPSCDKLAEYEVRELPLTMDGYIHSCANHVEHLLSDKVAHEVVRLVTPGDPTPVYR